MHLELKAHSQQLDDMEPKLVAIVTLAVGSSHEQQQQQQQTGSLAASPLTVRLLGQEALTNRYEALRARLSSTTLQAGKLLDALAAIGSLHEQHEADVVDAGATLERVLRELAELASNAGTSEEFRLAKLRVSHSSCWVRAWGTSVPAWPYPTRQGGALSLLVVHCSNSRP